MIECFLNRPAFERLPEDLQQIVLAAYRVANLDMLAELTARNQQALESLVNEHKVQLRALPDEVLKKLKALSEEVVAEIAAAIQWRVKSMILSAASANRSRPGQRFQPRLFCAWFVGGRRFFVPYNQDCFRAVRIFSKTAFFSLRRSRKSWESVSAIS